MSQASISLLAWAGFAIAAVQLFAVLHRSRIDLFDKRFDALRDIETASFGRLAEIREADSINQLKSEELSKFWHAQRRAKLLFKQPVQDAIADIEKALAEVLGAYAEMKDSVPFNREAYERWVAADLSVRTRLLTRVNELVDPYIEMRSGLLSPFRAILSDNFFGKKSG